MPTLISMTRHDLFMKDYSKYMTDRLINILTSAFIDFSISSECILSKVNLFVSLHVHTLQNVSYFYPFIITMNTLLLLAWINL